MNAHDKEIAQLFPENRSIFDLLKENGRLAVRFSLEELRQEWANLAGTEMVISSAEEIRRDYHLRLALMEKLQYYGHSWRWDVWTKHWFVENIPGKWVVADPNEFFDFGTR